MASVDIEQDDGLVIVSVGLELVAHDGGRNSRCWRVEKEVHDGMWQLVPSADEPLQVHVIRRTREELSDPMWHVREVFPKPRKEDCDSGDVGLYSEVVPA